MEKTPERQSFLRRVTSTLRKTRGSKAKLLPDAAEVLAQDKVPEKSLEIPGISLSDQQNSNFLWSYRRDESDNASEDSDAIDEPGRTRSSGALRRSDYVSRSREDTNESAKNYLGEDLVDSSSQIGYIFSLQDTQEIMQTESSDWMSDNDDSQCRTQRQFGNWNEGFQEISSRIDQFDKATPASEKIRAYADLTNLTEDFLLAARIFGRLIISEAHLLQEQKTLKSMPSLGGVIGGQKFLVHGILFKFSLDIANIFGPESDVIAAKIAGHELKSLGAASSFDPDLICPLMALIDYKGFRLIAMTQLPISKSTLAIGSCDGGLTILNRSAELSIKLERLGQSLNLKGHLVGPADSAQLLYTPVDLEGHLVGEKMYLCDFSRLLPPEKPVQSERQAYLYKLLRPEYVRLFGKPLSSDACSQFTKHHPNNKLDNSEVAEATQHLFDEVIPAVATDLEAVLMNRSEYAPTSFRLSSMLHANGVNVRHLFRIYQHLTHKMSRALVLIEMVARVVALDVRRKFRAVTRQMTVSLAETNHLQVLTSRLNLVFGSSQNSINYWNKHIRKQVWAKFASHLEKADAVQRYPMLSRHISFKAASMSYEFPSNMISMQVLFERLRHILGFALRSAISTQLEGSGVFARLCHRPVPFRNNDFDELGMRVKHMNLVSYAKGFQYFHQGLDARATDPKTALKYLSLSIKNFEDALAINTSSKVTLRACARALFYYDDQNSRAPGRVRKQSIESSSSGSDGFDSVYLSRADLYFRRAIVADPTDPESLCAFATFLDRIGRKEQAESFFTRAIRSEQTHVDSLKLYGDFLSDQGRFQESEVLYLLAREASRIPTKKD